MRGQAFVTFPSTDSAQYAIVSVTLAQIENFCFLSFAIGFRESKCPVAIGIQ